MELSTLTIADLYAAKSQAKEKESYYRTGKAFSPDAATSHTYWANMLNAFDAELSTRLTTITFKIPA